MKHSKSDVRSKCSAIAELRFEDQQLSSYAGLVVFEKLFAELGLKRRLTRCLERANKGRIYGASTMVMLLIVHMLLGYRRLGHLAYYHDDPMVKRVLGLSQLPTVATLSRYLSAIDDHGVAAVQRLQQVMVLETLAELNLTRVTLDFDGSVIGTSRRAEGVAMGFNRYKKGQRSYYPLVCTVAQTSQILAIHHRSGNVHDSNGAEAFICQCIEKVRQYRPKAVLEVRMDGAFFSDQILTMLEQNRVHYTVSVPYARYKSIKAPIDTREYWWMLNKQIEYFQKHMKLNAWTGGKRRFIFVRQRYPVIDKSPIQLDLFEPRDFDYQYKVIVTNKKTLSAQVIQFHDGRGAQEALFGELKSQGSLDYVPTNTWNGNKLYLIANILAHNLSREIQIRRTPRQRHTSYKRAPLWKFERLDTLRKKVIQRAGRLIRPQGKLTLSMCANETTKNRLLMYLRADLVPA